VRNSTTRVALLIIALTVGLLSSTAGAATYEDLTSLFREWRAFEQPAPRDGAPDYTSATLARKHEELKKYQARLAALNVSAWPVAQQVDYHLLRAEMNGLDFNIRVLQPWARDPAFYQTVWTDQSDTPAHEGPTHHALIDLWTYEFPLNGAAAKKLAAQLRVIPPLLAQARGNLTGNARDLWIAGTGTMKQQARVLEDLDKKTAAAGAELRRVIRGAHTATNDFVAWLEKEVPTKSGPSGVGKENYTWNLRNVHLVPMSWEEEVTLLQRELARAHAGLRFEEQRNREQPPTQVISSPEEYERRANAAVTKYMAFLKNKDIMTLRGFMDPAMRERIGRYEPEATRNFFAIARHHEPLTLFTHFYHWWDLAWMRDEPHASPIRRGPLLFNIWDGRSEGMATAMEEMMLQAGLYDDNPRAREVVWIMLAQRAARGLGSLYAQANEFTMKEAAEFHVKWTPRGWMSPKLDLLGFEQQLYLRQPGYGTSYITGKFLLEKLLAERSQQLGDAFSMKAFFDELNDAGVIPVSLIRWQMTGRGEEIDNLQ
jgi:hypothetical protein